MTVSTTYVTVSSCLLKLVIWSPSLAPAGTNTTVLELQNSKSITAQCLKLVITAHVTLGTLASLQNRQDRKPAIHNLTVLSQLLCMWLCG